MSSDPSLSHSALVALERQHQSLLSPSAAAAASASAGGGGPPPLPSSGPTSRDYRKGNWTVQETLVLITAKRLDDERRTTAPSAAGDLSAAPRSAEQRWKWVENYCWKQGCLRSQNQCNDKWDNLLRDYKKVRDYESRAATVAGGTASYWSLERHERKERNLPTNLSFEIYESLSDVISRRAAHRNVAVPLLPPPPPPPPAPPAQASVSVEMTPERSSETEGSGEGGGLGPSVVRGAAKLAQALMACEDRKERRHREMMELEERRLRMEENRTEMNRQAVAGIIAAVNDLSAAIHALAADNRSGRGR